MAMVLAAFGFGTPVLVDAAIKSVVLLALAALAAAAMRRSSAAAKHLVWFLGTLGVLVLPLASALSPGWQFSLSWPATSQRHTAASEPVAAAETPSPPLVNEAPPVGAISRKSVARPAAVAPAAPLPPRSSLGPQLPGGRWPGGHG